ncbi:MAG: hypothetical protein GY849_13195 [Deltaproteobacteria bacterium]|nr:hypothetical protein [Deltaproteobacteria bacterium]
MDRKGKIITLFLIILIVVLPCCFYGYVYYEVYYKLTRDAAKRIEEGAIDRIVASESPVYYDDGLTPMGVFFEESHLRYIPYENIPKVFIKAIIAAEDQNFFKHKGFDSKAVLRAFLANIWAGKVKQGGSTITQQTAKNVFEREKRSYKAKLKELIQAMVLEKKFTKEEILETYINQFFVTGYGKGLEIAAQYFFAKEAEDLDLVEAAFIAGSVKAPNRYNPFTKKTEAEKQTAINLANQRKDYVLNNMREMNAITGEEYEKAKETEVPLKEGKITYRLNVILDYIREQLESDFFKAVLMEQGVENIATSGISIYTSVNKEIQEAALASLRTRIPVLDVKMNGYDIKNIIEKSKEQLEDELKQKEGSLPFLAKIIQLDTRKESARLKVAWDNGEGVIDYEGFRAVADARRKWKRGPWAVFEKRDAPAFIKTFRVGDMVPVQVAPWGADNKESKLVLSTFPELNGGLIVLRKGMVKAMVGGFYNRFFNRAVDAKRQLGSMFKPIVYTAALQLNWNILDALQNMLNLYQFEDTLYVPRPDHDPMSQRVSMALAGAKSENLATVWLLYHLTDKLNLNEFRHVMRILGLGRRKDEGYLDYMERIRDEYGVNVNGPALMDAAFEQAKNQIESDLIFGGYEEMLENLSRLHLEIDEEALIESEELDLKKAEHRELLQEIMQLSLSVMRDRDKGISPVPEPFSSDTTDEDIFPHTSSDMDVTFHNMISPDILDLLVEKTNQNYKQLKGGKRYGLETLSKIRDFKALVNMHYVVNLAKKLGISTELHPVLSFPLGPYSVSIIEAALAYQTILTGRIHKLIHENTPHMMPIITRIADREGKTLWEYEPRSEQVLSPRVSRLSGEILRKVMEIGTGQKARNAVKLFDIPIPSFGKTGTANRFTNSSFVGFIPGPNNETGELDMKEGYVITCYVGFDDNRPMKVKQLEIYGASGALPLWVDTARAIVRTDAYKNNLELADIIFGRRSLRLPAKGKGFRHVAVSSDSGLPQGLSGSSARLRILTECEERDGALVLRRRFEPIEGEKK